MPGKYQNPFEGVKLPFASNDEQHFTQIVNADKLPVPAEEARLSPSFIATRSSLGIMCEPTGDMTPFRPIDLVRIGFTETTDISVVEACALLHDEGVSLEEYIVARIVQIGRLTVSIDDSKSTKRWTLELKFPEYPEVQPFVWRDLEESFFKK